MGIKEIVRGAAEKFEDRLMELDHGPIIQQAKLHDFQTLQQVVEDLTDPWVVVKYNEGFVSELEESRISDRIGGEIAWEYVLSTVDKLVKSEGVLDGLHVNFKVRQKNNKLHLAVSKPNSGEKGDYSLNIYITEQPTFRETIERPLLPIYQFLNRYVIPHIPFK